MGDQSQNYVDYTAWETGINDGLHISSIIKALSAV